MKLTCTGCFCFHKDTKVRMADGSQKKISEVRRGDVLMDAGNGHEHVVDTVTGFEQELIRITMENGDVFEIEPIVSVHTEKGVVVAEELHCGDKLLVIGQNSYKVGSVERQVYNDRVYGIIFEGREDLLANGFVIPENAHALIEKRKSELEQELARKQKEILKIQRELEALNNMCKA